MYSLGLILQRLCGFTGIYRAARAPKKKEKENQSRVIFHPSLKFKLSFSLSDHRFLRSCPSQGDLQRPLPKKCHYYCRCKEAEKQGSREGPKLLSAAWKEHRSPSLPSIWAPGKIATWRNGALEKKHIEDEKFQTLQCSTKQNGSHWSEHFLTQTMHLCKSGVYNLNG